MEDNVNKNVFNLISFLNQCLKIIKRYFKTLLGLLFYPHKTLDELSLTSNSLYFTKPGTFFVINIILAYSIGQFVGYEVQIFPFPIPILKNIFGGYTFLILRFVLGLFIFLLILKFFMKFKSSDKFISLIFPILCFGSFIYLPIIFVKNIYYYFFLNDMINLLSSFLSNIPLKFNLVAFVKYLLFVPIAILIFFWWIWLIDLGIKSFKIRTQVKAKKAILLSCLLFYFLQFTTSFIYSTIEDWEFLKGAKIMALHDIERELSKKPPDYLKASSLAGIISNNEKFPPFVRYVFKLREITYLTAIPYLKIDEKLTNNAFKTLEEKNYTYLKELLTKHKRQIQDSLVDETDIFRKTFYTLLMNDIDEIDKIRNSPLFDDFKEYPMMTFGFSYGFGEFGIPCEIDKSNNTIHLYLMIRPSLVSLFP